jgi:peptidoglycan hydrolase CwlO-like protein
MSYYKEYIKGLCPECEDWVITQICGELDSRDEEIKELKKEIDYLDSRIKAFTEA